jgi:L-threonylcarbamoyladenylate synthase
MQNNNQITTDIEFATRQLIAGELVAFPTETVYGLGADATNPIAIQKVFAAKGRPFDHPLIVHIANAKQLPSWARNIPDSAWTLAEHFWPGPLTLILHKQVGVLPLITGGQETIAIRIPNHPLTLQLVQNFAGAIVGPSANKYGRVSPTTAAHVATDLGDAVAVILDGGECAVGLESTIIDLTNTQPVVRRNGAITALELSNVLGQQVLMDTSAGAAVRTSGTHESHYAPVTTLRMLTYNELLIAATLLLKQHKTFSVLSFKAMPQDLNSKIYWQQTSPDPREYAHNLYANLRLHDALNNSVILIERPSEDPAWLAILDRLTRASA